MIWNHVLHSCSRDCTGCHFCDGGLALCTVCKGAEASLPTHCPGYAMNEYFQDKVQSGDLDYKEGSWRENVMTITNSDTFVAKEVDLQC